MPNTPIPILHADSNRRDRDLLRNVLTKSTLPFRVTGAATRAEVETSLAEADYAVVVSDQSLCDVPRLEIVELVRTKKPDLPVVILSGAGSEELAAESIRRGAADYVSKRNIERLPAVLARLVTEKQAPSLSPQGTFALRSLVDSLDAVLFSVDRRYRYTSFNQAHVTAMREFYGTHINVGDNLLHCMTVASDREAIRHNLDRALTGERILYDEGSAQLPHTRRHFLASYSPIEDAGGSIVGVAVLAQDVTLRLAAEQALRDSERRLAEAQRIAHIGYWERDLRAAHMTLSEEACRIFGIMPEAVPLELARWHQRWLELIHPEDQPRAAKAAADALSGGPAYNLEYRVVQPGGEIRFIHSEAEVKRDAEGRPLSMLGMMQDITEHKRALDALREAEQRARRANRTYALLSDINQLIVRTREDQVLLQGLCQTAVRAGGFLFAWVGLSEDAGLKLSCYATEDPEVRSAYAHIFSDSPTSCRLALRALADGAHVVCNDVRADAACAEWRAGALTLGHRSVVSLRLNIGGQSVGVLNLYASSVGFFDDEEMLLLDRLATDVGFALESYRHERERLHALQLLRSSEERFRELAENIQEVFWVSDAERRQILYVSPAYEKVWGRSPDHLYRTSSTWPEAVVPEDREQIEKADGRQPAAVAYSEEYRIVRPDGVQRWIHERAFPVRGAQGNVERIVGVAEDVTEQKLAQERLRRSEEHFRLLIENASDLIIVTDSEGSITFVSPSVESILGYLPEELVGMNIFDLVHPDDVSDAVDALAQAVDHPGVAVAVEYRTRRKDQQWAVIQTVERSMPGQSASGFVVLNSRDLSEHRRLEEQLRQSQKLEAIGQLAGGIAHDFNNLLAAITMEVSLLQLEALPEQVNEGLMQIDGAVERAASLTRQLLMFSRRQVLQRRTLDLNQVVVDLSKMLVRIIGEDIQLDIALHQQPLPTLADPGMLDQLLLNLAVNARDAMPQGGRLSIRTEPVAIDRKAASEPPDAAGRRYARLTVSDTGTGITKENLERIFEPFFSTKAEGKGTGLGLATVFGIVKQHQGWIEVESTVGEGTTFRVFLPLSESTPTEKPGRQQSDPLRGTETILVVEDEVRVRKLTSTALERYGYTVLQAADGESALRLWLDERAHVALLLSDLVLPGGVSGLELARRLREHMPNLKVMFMSGYSTEVAGRQMELGEGESFLPKPFTLPQLMKAVRGALDA